MTINVHQICHHLNGLLMGPYEIIFIIPALKIPRLFIIAKKYWSESDKYWSDLSVRDKIIQLHIGNEPYTQDKKRATERGLKSQKIDSPEGVLRYFSLCLFNVPKWLFSQCVCTCHSNDTTPIYWHEFFSSVTYSSPWDLGTNRVSVPPLEPEYCTDGQKASDIYEPIMQYARWVKKWSMSGEDLLTSCHVIPCMIYKVYLKVKCFMLCEIRCYEIHPRLWSELIVAGNRTTSNQKLPKGLTLSLKKHTPWKVMFLLEESVDRWTL